MLSVRLVTPDAGTRPVVRKLTAAAVAGGPATVVCRKRPGMRGTVGKRTVRVGETPRRDRRGVRDPVGERTVALGESPRLDHSEAVTPWPMLPTRRSWNIPKPARKTP